MKMKNIKNMKSIFHILSDYFKKLLMHGSQSQFYGYLIIRFKTSFTPVSNGSVLGKGIYFADVSTKSFNYCGIHWIFIAKWL